MRRVSYASAIKSLMFVMIYTRPDISYAIEVVSRYQPNLQKEHYVIVKHILKYLYRSKGYMLVYSGNDITPIEYMNLDFQSNLDSRKSTSK